MTPRRFLFKRKQIECVGAIRRNDRVSAIRVFELLPFALLLLFFAGELLIARSLRFGGVFLGSAALLEP